MTDTLSPFCSPGPPFPYRRGNNIPRADVDRLMTMEKIVDLLNLVQAMRLNSLPALADCSGDPLIFLYGTNLARLHLSFIVLLKLYVFS